VLINRYYSGEQIQEDEKSVACYTYGGKEKYMSVLVVHLKEGDIWETCE
jgi:hypothetical protein